METHMNASEVVETDLTYIVDSLSDEMNMLSGKRVLITGGGGFLGYYLVQSLVKWNQSNYRSHNSHIDILY